MLKHTETEEGLYTFPDGTSMPAGKVDLDKIRKINTAAGFLEGVIALNDEERQTLADDLFHIAGNPKKL